MSNELETLLPFNLQGALIFSKTSDSLYLRLITHHSSLITVL
jgi:hypothetical protein